MCSCCWLVLRSFASGTSTLSLGRPRMSDGSPAKLPIALCEHQGLVMAGQRAWADVVETVFTWPPACARRSTDWPGRSAERFWWEAEGTYYLGLDGDKGPIDSGAAAESPSGTRGLSSTPTVRRWPGWRPKPTCGPCSPAASFTARTGEAPISSPRWPNASDMRRCLRHEWGLGYAGFGCRG
jgi:hypothetical protein